ncbi:MAG: ribonuclease R [Bacteroidales bacterium]|nr:ribonuclease R [Bacteroidales bacterium]
MARRKQSEEQHFENLRQRIIKFFQEAGSDAFNYKQVTEGIGRKSKKDREEVQDQLYVLTQMGQLNEVAMGRFALPLSSRGGRVVVGTVDMTSSGAAYIVPDDRDAEPDDIFVDKKRTNTAMQGDRVEVAILRHNHGHKPDGEIINILQRKRETFVGIVDVTSNAAFLVCNPKQTGGHDIYIPLSALNGAQKGQKAIAKVTRWPENGKNPEGEIVTVLGNMGDNQTEMHAILAEYGLPYSYPSEVASEADAIEPGITPAEVAKRIDMRGVTTFTIDPADAKDFDDALSLRKLDNGNWEVGIHIADVTHYVTPGTIIDQEGYDRATSVYLVDRVVPMLPERLSNFLCSLRPDEEKLTFSVIAELNDDAEVVGTKISKTVIKSNRRFTYEEAQAIIEGGEGDYKEEVLKLNELAQKMRARRFEHGSVKFERVEPRFTIDENGRPLSVYFKEAKESNMLVEEFMLLANRRVAEFVGKNEVGAAGGKRSPKTFVYRVHDQPSEERYAKFATFIRRFGYEATPKKGESISNAVNRVLGEVKGKGEQELVEVLALRTMAKAAYTTNNIGHYGLAFEYYTHFTSPIRRYPDMMVHRLLFSYMNGGNSANADAYEDKCKHCSEREVLAAEAERDSIKYKQCEFLLERLGEEFDAHISGVTEWGLYAEINENMCEGMVSVRDMDDDMYTFDEESYSLVGKNTGKRYRLGDQIRVRIANANLEKKQIDMAIAGSPLTSIEIQNQKVLAAGGNLLKIQQQAALSHADAAPKKAASIGGRGGKSGHGRGRRDSGGIPPKSVLDRRKAKGRDGSKKKGGRKKK